MATKRSGASLVEVLIVVAILALIVGLLLPAVQQVREASARARSQNNLRQIALACHHYAAAHDRRLPNDIRGSTASQSYMAQLTPFLDQPLSLPHMPIFVSPADPTAHGLFAKEGFTSYAGNGHVFDGGYTQFFLPASFSDGTSNTLLFAEHYAWCDKWQYKWMHDGSGMPGFIKRPVFGSGIGPLTTGTPPESVADHPDPNITFQTRPCAGTRLGDTGTPEDTARICAPRPMCHERLAQTPHPGGMLTALADGSVRQLRPAIAPKIYWGAVTPAGGETLADW